MDKQNENNIFPQGERGNANYFTGTTWVTNLVPRGGDINYTVGSVVFEPGARTNWHTHPAGQVLLVTDGNGLYQQKGKAAQPLKKGDVVNIPANVQHWHGASANHRLVHVAISNYKGDGDTNVTWLTAVTEEEYSNANR